MPTGRQIKCPRCGAAQRIADTELLVECWRCHSEYWLEECPSCHRTTLMPKGAVEYTCQACQRRVLLKGARTSSRERPQLRALGRLALGIGAVVVVALVIGHALGGGGSSAGGGGGGPSPAGDASAQLACTHFRNVASDYSAGVLTADELRTKLQQVYGDAQYSSSAGIASGAQRMLADATQGGISDPDLPGAVSDFDSACTQAGF